MQVRVTTVRKGERTYQYAQLVESFRRPKDGMPVHRVVAHLGALTPQEIANLRLALAASRQGRSVVVPSTAVERPASRPVLANLAYLDIAVALSIWRQWRLDDLLAELLPQAEREAPPAAVVAALTIQRCVAPGSKLYAERWFPRTALPELLGLPPGQFNNTRLHRVLDQLDGAGPKLQKRLPERYAARDGAFTALFLDVTDTWFVGHGPELAAPGKTKEGLYQRKVGIVLMCNQAGLPLRWQVIPGRQHDSQAMMGVIEEVRDLGWVGDAPVICDRAMGKTAHLRKLLATGLRFLTALSVDEFDAYTQRVPHAALATCDAFASDGARQAAMAAEQAGMICVNPRLYVLDLGVVERRADTEAPCAPPPARVEHADRLQRALGRARAMREELDAGRAVDFRDAGRAYGLRKERVAKLMRLLRLAPDLQQDIAAGRAAGVAINAALRVAALTDPQAQREEFDRQRLAAPHRKPPAPPSGEPQPTEDPVRLRALICFNPEQFVEQRLNADETLAQVRAFVEELNGKLLSPRARRDEKSAHAELHRELRRRDLLDAFDIVIGQRQHENKSRLVVELRLRPDAWQRRRRFDGFSILVAHPKSLQSAADLAQLYRAKDMVEQDFHVIKSVVQLRPVRHRTDAKVRAHVTLCMLALLIERTLEHKLAKNPACAMTAAAALELLKNVHLNQLALTDTPCHTVTRPSQDQLAILQTLELQALVEDEEVAQSIVPR